MARKTPVKNKNKTENQPKEVPGKKPNENFVSSFRYPLLSPLVLL